MFESRHAAVVAGLGTGGVFAFPTSAAAWEGIVLPNVLTEIPGLAFAIGAVAGFAVVGAVFGVSELLDRRSAGTNGSHFVDNVVATPKLQPVEEPSAPMPASRHMRMDVEPTTPAVGAHAPRGKHFAVAEEPELPAQPLTIAERVPSPEITDYVRVAERYVNNEESQKKKATRARGVAAVLVERMDLQKGFPTIERGVSQVNFTDSWWDDLEPVSSNITAVSEREAAELAARENRAIAREKAAKRRKSERITRSVPQIDQGIYPELRTAADLDEGEDLWAMALSAMEDHMPPVVFSDNVGNADTIDEPDGLAANTNFLTFRSRARRPELNDTAAFINYIVGDELSRSSSAEVRRRSKSYLTLLEGGTQNTGRVGRHVRGTRELQPSTVGKHFAVAAEA